jgi:hypothetical protein
MRQIGSIYSSKGRLDGQSALGCEGDYVENFPYNYEFGSLSQRGQHTRTQVSDK